MIRLRLEAKRAEQSEAREAALSLLQFWCLLMGVDAGMICFLGVPYTSCLAIFQISFSLLVVDTDMVVFLRIQSRPPSEPSEARRARRLLRNQQKS